MSKSWRSFVLLFSVCCRLISIHFSSICIIDNFSGGRNLKSLSMPRKSKVLSFLRPIPRSRDKKTTKISFAFLSLLRFRLRCFCLFSRPSNVALICDSRRSRLETAISFRNEKVSQQNKAKFIETYHVWPWRELERFTRRFNYEMFLLIFRSRETRDGES